jgi:hypothetical protein
VLHVALLRPIAFHALLHTCRSGRLCMGSMAAVYEWTSRYR